MIHTKLEENKYEISGNFRNIDKRKMDKKRDKKGNDNGRMEKD